MKYITAAVTLALYCTNFASAALCRTKGIVGIGDSETTFPPDYQFILFGRNSSGTLLGVNGSMTGDYAPLKLDDASVSLFGFPRFELINGQLRTFNQPYRYVTTMGNPLLQTMELFTSPEGVGMPVSVVANNASCDSGSAFVIRYQGLVPVSSGSGATNGTFEVGATLTSPILSSILPINLLRPIDMVLKFF